MSAASTQPLEPTQPTQPVTREERAARLVALVDRAFDLARTAVAAAIDGLAGSNPKLLREVHHLEAELDQLDREVDEHVKTAVVRAPEAEVPQLLACMKFMTDLERIGDLLLGFASRAAALNTRLDMQDTADLIRMGTALYQMLSRIHDALQSRNLDMAVEALRADAEIDRLRNLIYLRRLEQAETTTVHDTIQVFFMAQALERAGDHAKNLAEEVCHLASGHTMRHVLRSHDRTTEQMFLLHVRKQRKAE
jgi:phosphate transport system protein